MDVKQISMDKGKAWQKWKSYLQAIKARQDREITKTGTSKERRRKKSEHIRDLETLKDTYRQLSLGHSVLDINAAFRKTGTNHLGQPRLAIARPHLKWVKFWRGRRDCSFDSFLSRRDGTWSVRARNRSAYNAEFLPGPDISQMDAITAMIPLVPIEFMPGNGLANYHILFEPEWRVEAPEDPILLKHLGGPMYVVLAQWDLTEIERAVLFDSRIKD